MASAYPAALDTFAVNKANATVTANDHPAHHNDLADAINKIEAELGVDPSGAEATLAARLAAMHRQWVGGYSLGNPWDIWWNGEAAGMTVVTVGGTQTITERNGLLSVKFQGQAGTTLNALLKAHTFAVGDAFACRINSAGVVQTMADLVITDGVVAGSNMITAMQFNDGSSKISVWSGTMNAVGGPNWSTALPSAGTLPADLYVKMTYQAANSFRIETSSDGISWTTMGQPDVTKTMVPTHIGVGWSKWGSAGDSVASFGPLVKLA